MRQERRRWWTRLVTVLAVLMVLAATISVSFRLVVDAVPGYRSRLENLVATSVGHRARIGSMALTWRRLQPTLELRDVALLDASGAALLAASRLNLGIGLWSLLHGQLGLTRLEAAGIELQGDIDSEGVWTLRGVDTAAGDSGDRSALLDDLQRFDSLRILDSKLLLRDARLGSAAPLQFKLAQALIRHDSTGHYALDATLDPPSVIAQRLTLKAALLGDPGQPAGWHGNFQLAVEGLAGWPWLAAQLKPGVELSFQRSALRLVGSISQGAIEKATLDLQIGSLIGRHNGEVQAEVSDLQLQASAAAQADSAWQVAIEQLLMRGRRGVWNAGNSNLQHAAGAEGGSLHVESAQLRLDDLLPWLALAQALPDSARRLGDLRGDAEGLQLDWTPADDQSPAQIRMHAHLHGLGLASESGQPGFSGLEGQLEGSLDHGQILLGGSPLQLHLPEEFEQDVAIESLRGALVWQRQGPDWQLSAPGLDLRLLGAEAEGDAALMLAGEPGVLSVLKLGLRLRSTDAAVLKPLMPKSWGPNTRAWLEQALRHARVTRGELKIDSAMTPQNAEGHTTMPWRLDLDIADGELDYAPGWPAARGLNARLSFHDAGMDISADAGEVSGNRISRLKATLADFHGSPLLIDGSVAGDATNFYRLLRESPLQTRVGNLLHLTEASGAASVDVHLEVPLNLAEVQVKASGEIRLDDVQLAIRGVDQPLRALQGLIRFGASGLQSDALDGRFYDSMLHARIQPEADVGEGVLSGEFAFAPAALGGIEEAFVPAWLRAGLSGHAQMHLRLPFSGPQSGRLSLLSDLRGIASGLPPPLAKQADDSLALAIGIGGDDKVPLRLQIEAGEVLGAGLRFAEVDGELKTRGVELRLGTGAPPKAEADGLVVNGAPAELDLASWGALLGAAQGGDASLPFTRADLHPQRLVYHGYALAQTHLLATPGPDRLIHLVLDGAANGVIDWSASLVRARLQAVAFEALAPLSAAAGEPAKESPFDPTKAPLIDIDCAVLTLGEVELGHLEALTARVPDGQRIEHLRLSGGKLSVDAHGDWLRRAAAVSEPGSSADLGFEVESSAIADVLRVFGYAPNLRADEARFAGKLHWPRVPEGLELAQAEGTVGIEAKRGTLKAIEPGAGRVLGLINLYALPRRLLLDFRDVVSEGLAFDTIKGDFSLAGGDADTRDLQIIGPQAKVRLEGRIGLAARDYDQRVTVTPDISTGVTLGATLIGGPIGGGIALVAQSLFGKPFNRLARFSYRVTGSWANPELIPEVVKGAQTATPPPKPPVVPGANDG